MPVACWWSNTAKVVLLSCVGQTCHWEVGGCHENCHHHLVWAYSFKFGPDGGSSAETSFYLMPSPATGLNWFFLPFSRLFNCKKAVKWIIITYYVLTVSLIYSLNMSMSLQQICRPFRQKDIKTSWFWYFLEKPCTKGRLKGSTA